MVTDSKNISIENLKRRAKALAKKDAITHSEALDRLAREAGFPSFKVLTSKLDLSGTHATAVVSLLGSPIPVSRTLVVPTSLNFEQFHVVLQMAMGWEHSHLFSFDIGNKPQLIGQFDAQANGLGSAQAAWKTDLQSVLAKGIAKASYTYDFGDDWRHEISFEKYTGEPLVDHAVVLENAEGLCPPEDCGGIDSFGRIITSYTEDASRQEDVSSERTRADWENWLGKAYDPFTAVDVASIQRELDLWSSQGFSLRLIYDDEADLIEYFNNNPRSVSTSVDEPVALN